MREVAGSTLSEIEEAIAIFNFILAVSVILINCFILTMMLSNWKALQCHCNNKASILLTINLCTADLIMGISDFYYCLPVYLENMKEYMGKHEILCIMSFSLVTMTNMASGYSLIAIAVERYIYVVHALRYFQHMNTRRVILMIAIVWFVAIVGTLPIYFWNDWSDNVTLCDDFVIEPVEYVVIFGISRVVVIMITITIFHLRIHHAAQKIQGRTEPVPKINLRSGRTVLIITCIFFISWMPSSVTYICMKCGVLISPVFYKFTVSIIDINYIANPFIYTYNNRGIRNTITKSLKCFKFKCTPNCYNRFYRRESGSSGTCASQQTDLSTVNTMENNHVIINEP